MDKLELRQIANARFVTLTGNKSLDLTINGYDGEQLTDKDLQLIRAHVNALALHVERPERKPRPRKPKS